MERRARLKRVLKRHPPTPCGGQRAGRGGGVTSDGGTDPRLAPWLPGKPAEGGPAPAVACGGGRILAGPGQVGTDG